jgi:hypothetical protein
MKTTNLLLIGAGALGAYLLLKSRTKKQEGVLVNPTAVVPNNPRITPPNTIDPPQIVLAKAASALLPAPTASGAALNPNVEVSDVILASARSQGVPPSAVIKANLL